MIVVSLALVYVESQLVQMANGNTAKRQLGQAGRVNDGFFGFIAVMRSLFFGSSLNWLLELSDIYAKFDDPKTTSITSRNYSATRRLIEEDVRVVMIRCLRGAFL